MLEKDLPKAKRLDEHWWNINDILDPNTEKPKYKNLADLCFAVMTLSVTNVEAERGFSINQSVLDGRESLSEKTLVSYRLVRDFILHHDNDCLKVNITNEMLSFANRAHKDYMENLRDQKDLESLAKEEAEKVKLSLQKEKNRIEKNKNQEDLKTKIREIKSKIIAAEKLVEDGNKEISTGISTNELNDLKNVSF